MKKATTATSVDRFPVCIPFTLAQEEVDPANWSDPKNYSVDPVPTFNGVEQSEFWLWLKQHGLPQVSVKDMSQSQGYAIYRSSYWLPYCPAMPAGLDLSYFDSAVNQGMAEATRILQVALGIQNDGVWGPITAGAVSRISNVKNIVEAFTARRIIVYRETEYDGRDAAEVHADWQRRATEIGAEALKMVTA